MMRRDRRNLVAAGHRAPRRRWRRWLGRRRWVTLAAAGRPGTRRRRPGRGRRRIPPAAEEMVDRLYKSRPRPRDRTAAQTQVARAPRPPPTSCTGARSTAEVASPRALDIVICTPHLVYRATYLRRHSGRLARAVFSPLLRRGSRAAGQATRAVTFAGAVTAELAGSVLFVSGGSPAPTTGGRGGGFPGQEWLAVERPVADVLDRTAIEEVRGTWWFVCARGVAASVRLCVTEPC